MISSRQPNTLSSTKKRWQNHLAQLCKIGLLTLPLTGLAATLQGIKFNDANGNGIQDPGDKGLGNEVIYIRHNDIADLNPTEGFYTLYTESSGKYTFDYTDPGSYTLRTDVPWDWQVTTIQVDELDSSYTTTLTGNDVEINFGLWDGEIPECQPLIVDAGPDITTDVGERLTMTGTFIHQNCATASTRSQSTKTNKYHITRFFGDGNLATRIISAASASDPITQHFIKEHTFVDADTHTSTLAVSLDALDVIATKAQTTATDTITITARSLDSDPCKAGIPTIKSKRSGNWNDRNIWNPAKVPHKNSWVKISAAHTITLPRITDPNQPIQVKGLCISANATLQSAPNTFDLPPTWIAISAATLNNQGTLRGADGLDGSGPLFQQPAYRNATAGSNISIKAQKVINDGQIIAGKGGTDAIWKFLNDICCVGAPARGGQGGSVEIYPSVITNNGLIEAGKGGDVDRVNGVITVHGPTQVGNGGLVRIMPTNIEDSSNTGQIRSGKGGDTETNMLPIPAPAIGGNVEVNFGINTGTIQAGGPGTITQLDPLTLQFGNTTRIEDTDDIIIFGDNGAQLQLTNLSENALSALKTITLAVGPGGVIDFRGSAANALSAPQAVTIFSDSIQLDDGVNLATLIDTPNLITESAKILYYTSWSGVHHVVGEPNTTLSISQTLNNGGPESDNYTLSLSDTAGWTISDIPTTLMVNGLRHSEIEFDITLPAQRGAQTLLTLTATSQTDPTVQASTTIQVNVLEAENITPRDGTKADISLVIDATLGYEKIALANALTTYWVNNLATQTQSVIELITFTDAAISRVVTQDLGDIITRIKNLRPVEPGDCPNASVAALALALENLNSNGQIFLATATSPHQDPAPWITQAQQQGVKTHVMLSSGCGDDEANQGLYENLANQTGGAFNWSAHGEWVQFEEWFLARWSDMMAGLKPNELYRAFGTIRDKLNQPLAGVTVQVGNQTTLTDEQGQWEIDGLLEGDYTVTASQAGYLFESQACVVSNNQDCQLTFKPQSALEVKVNAPRTVKQGEDVTYTVEVTNRGEVTVTGVTLQEHLPNDTQLISLASLDGGNCDTNTLTCQLPALLPDAVAKMEVIIGNTKTKKLRNTVTVTANEYPADVQVSSTTVIPYLSVTVDVTPDPVNVQGTINYTLVVKLSEFAPASATNVELKFNLPDGVELQNVSVADNVTCDSSHLPSVSCLLPELSNEQWESVVKVEVSLQDAGLLLLTLEAQVSANEYPLHVARARTKVVVPEDIEVDIAFVIDVTGSMQEEINGVINALQQFIARMDSDSAPLSALVVFKDNVNIDAFTTNMEMLQQAIEGLKASGGDDCSEASVEALNLAIPHVKNGGDILFATDASPYADAEVETVVNLLRDKGIRFNAMITGDCSDQSSWNELPK